MITITKERYIQLRQAQITLIALDNGGVDNWEWYIDSLPSEEDLAVAEKEAEEHNVED